jgi:large subunit ribosomal protein L10
VLSRAQKEDQVADLRQRFGRASSVILADYRGLTVGATEELRGALRQDPESESEYHVIKNSVLKHAVKDSDLDVLTEHLTGPTACAVTYGDPVALAKVLVDFQKKHDVFELKGGYLDGKALDSGEIATLATLPNLQELRGKLVGLLVAPATKLVRLLNEPGAQLARLVEARRAALEEAGGSSD